MADETLSIAHTHTLIHRLADGDHVVSVTSDKSLSDEKVLAHVKNVYGDRLVSLKRSTPEEHGGVIKKNLEDYASRTPLDEKTGGQMARAILNPELAEAP